MSHLVVDLLHFYPVENAKRHKTERYELVHLDPATPVLRRGQAFHAVLRMQGAYAANKDQVRLVFTYGPKPNGLKGTRGVLDIPKLGKTLKPKLWSARIVTQTEDSVTLEIITPPDAPVGSWNVSVEIPGAETYEYEQDFYILFNPWCKDDQVYMDDAALLDEYILNDVGKIWVGPWGSSRGREWVFGQFDDCILPSITLMMYRAGLSHSQHGDPVAVARTISKIVNSNDDQGVLVGRWDGDYDDGTAPAAWTGSVAILEEFLETENEVSYGQCWVFAGVVTTVCRALGIPSRVVSNLVSAHDANCSLSVDKYYDMNNEEIDYDPTNREGEDSIWNYHVWNDVWMARPDLPTGYGGWQAIDATPQETSGSFYQCGPASLEAIKQGQVGYSYDVPFMLASVNADLMRWKEDPSSDLGFQRVDCNKYHIGRMILTKQPWIFDPNGDQDRQDITDQYKAKEGSKSERLTLYNAAKQLSRAKRFYSVSDSAKEDVVFDLVELERVNIGDPFCVTVNIKNNSDEDRTVSAVLSAGSVFYTGIKANCVKKTQGEFVVRSKSSEEVRMVVSADEYIEHLVEYGIMKLYAIASVKETTQTWADEDDFQVRKPSIDLKLPAEIIQHQPCQVTLSFINPLKKPLTNCIFRLCSPGLVYRTLKVNHADTKPGGLLSVDFPLTPKVVGKIKLVATFSSKELLDVVGSAEVEVYEE